MHSWRCLHSSLDLACLFPRRSILVHNIFLPSPQYFTPGSPYLSGDWGTLKIYFLLKLDWGWAEHGHGGAAAIWSLMTLLSVRLPQPSTERRMDTTCPSERERKLISVAADGWRTLVERLTVGGVAAVSTCSMWDQIENCEDIPRRAVHSARLPGVSPRENQF